MVPAKEWHPRTIQLAETLHKKLEDFPAVDFDLMRRLQDLRNKMDYGILSRVSAVGTKGLRIYFEHLPSVVNTLNQALKLLRDVFEHKSYSGAQRFKNLYRELPEIYERCGFDYPKDEILGISF